MTSSARPRIGTQIALILIEMGGDHERIKAGFSAWNQRIAPVFDVARHLLLVEADGPRLVSESQLELVEEAPLPRSFQLAELGLETLVCGAISRPMLTSIAAYGIRVVPFVTGPLKEVVQAWLSGTLESNVYAMPGFCFPKRRRGHARDTCEGERAVMQSGNRGGGGPRRGQGSGGRGRRGSGGRQGGPVAGGPGGQCICPKCGHVEPHERGVPCLQRTCPECGTVMTRQQ